jgi:hypothetical protein
MDYLHLILDIGLTTDPDVILQKIMERQPMKFKLREETQRQVDEFFRQMPEEQKLKYSFLHDVEQQGIRKTLVRQLHRQFAPLPKSVLQKVEATHDQKQLENWIDQIITANSLADMGLLTK